MPKSASPFLEIAEAEWLCANGLCFAIFDSFPVSPGHVLVITRRVVPTFFECTPAEQAALMELVSSVKTLLDKQLHPQPDGYNVGFNAGAAARIGHVAGIPRDHMDMHMRHRLPGSGARIKSHVVAIVLRIELRIEERFDAGDELHQGSLLGRRALKEGGHHAARDHQHMPGRHRK